MVQVRVSEGILEGEVVQNEYGGIFYSFKGIPYAQPPLAELRFKAPVPLKPWTGVRAAKEFGPESIQYDEITRLGVLGSEDCLYLNVFTPDMKPKTPLPVMFWIHGGGFVSGSGNDHIFGPEFLMRKDVILVTINYRLDILGYLCLNSKEIPGNAGMKDQVAALRWVNKNISQFGGDPNNVTIFGESVGGTSVSYHLVSPMTKGLFRRAICQSGAGTCWWGKVLEPRERSLVIARKLGCYSEDDQELYEFFKAQPAEALIGVSAPLSFAENHRTGYVQKVGVVSETKFDNNEVYFSGVITDYLPNGIHEGVDIVAGYVENEGLVLAAFGPVSTMVEQGNVFNTYFTPTIIRQKAPLAIQIEVGKKIKQYYLSNNRSEWKGINRFHSLEAVVYGVLKFAKLCAESSNKVYFYKFTAESSRNIISKILGVVRDTIEPCHIDELFYLFNARAITERVDVNSKTFEIIDNITKLWTNFAKTGNPTPDGSVKWKQFTSNNLEYLNIGNKLEASTKPDNEDIIFWDNLFKEYAEYC